MAPNKDQIRLSIEQFRTGGYPHMAAVLEKMCEFVGAPLKVVNKTPTWYMAFSWTEAEMKEFEEWMAAYLKNDKKAYREFCPSWQRYTLKNCKKAAHEFACWYGWKTKYTPDGEKER